MLYTIKRHDMTMSHVIHDNKTCYYMTMSHVIHDNIPCYTCQCHMLYMTISHVITWQYPMFYMTISLVITWQYPMLYMTISHVLHDNLTISHDYLGWEETSVVCSSNLWTVCTMTAFHTPLKWQIARIVWKL